MDKLDEFSQGMVMIRLSNRRSYAAELQLLDVQGNIQFYCRLQMRRRGMIVSRAGTKAELKKSLTEVCIMHLDMGLHRIETFTFEVMNSKISLN